MTTATNTLVSRKYAKRSNAAEVWHRLKSNKGAIAGFTIIVIILSITLYSILFISFEEVTAINVQNRLQPPSLKHPFGTDDMGRDLFLKTLYGSRYSLLIGLGGVSISLIVGLILGSIAGYFGGLVDDLIMRFSDFLASIPTLLLGMVIVTVLGQSLPNLILAVGVTAIPEFIRITRSSVLVVRNQEFVEAATAIGMSHLGIIFTQVIPNGLSPIIVTVTSRIGAGIIEAASLSFLGFGIPVPHPEWGLLVSEGRNYMRIAPHLTYFPGLFIMVTVFAFNILGDGLRDALDPKLKK
jgi:peptide/nickel transport system permease protein